MPEPRKPVHEFDPMDEEPDDEAQRQRIMQRSFGTVARQVSLDPGESTQVTVRIDPRLLGVFSQAAGGWRIAPGVYHIQIGASARDLKLATSVQLDERRLPVA